MDEVMKALRNLGLQAELAHTGGGIMVAYVDGKNFTIGVDEYSVVLYDTANDAFDEAVTYVDESEDDTQRIANLARQAMFLKQLADFSWNGVPFWNAFCNCKEHKGKQFTRVPKAVAFQLTMDLQIDPLTNKGAMAINKAILHGVN
jgi:hypothetical protein